MAMRTASPLTTRGAAGACSESLRAAGIDALLVGPSSDLFYLIGLNRPQSERLTHFIPARLPKTRRPRLILPSFETALAEPLAHFFDLVPWEETESPFELFAASLPPAAKAGQQLRLAVADQIYAHFLYKPAGRRASRPNSCAGGELAQPRCAWSRKRGELAVPDPGRRRRRPHLPWPCWSCPWLA